MSALVVLSTLLLFPSPAESADTPKGKLAALEQKLHGRWQGPPCGGDWTFSADGGFAVENYSPGGHKFSGNWNMRWDALPPTLILKINASNAPKFVKIGETWEFKILKLNGKNLTYDEAKDPGLPIEWERPKAGD